MTICTNCNGQGLVSTSENQLDLEHGRKETCTACGGTGQVAELVAEPAQTEETGGIASSEVSADTAPQDTENDLPKEDGQPSQEVTGEESGEQSETIKIDGLEGPKVGDKCVDDAGNEGTLETNEAGEWYCKIPAPTE